MIDRRRFLTGALAGAAALALQPPAALAAALRTPGDAFAAGLAQLPWLAGWNDAPALDGTAVAAEIVGRWPATLRGTLYRNGPGRFSRAGLRYRHWFDGDGLLQAWDLHDRGVAHRARPIATRKFVREEAAGRFVLPAVGTPIPGALPIRNNDDLNTANTAVYTHAGRLYALWEGGSAYELEPRTLQAIGPRTWRADAEALPYSAHPLVESDGSVWNFGMMNGVLLLWHLDAAGALRELRQIAVPFPGYLHAFSMTPTHLVLVLLPYVRTPAGADEAYFDSLRWQPERGCRAFVVAKADLDAQRWYGLPAGAAYHYGPARQLGREIELQACWNEDGAGAISPFRAEMAGRSVRVDGGASLQRIRLHLDNGRATMETMHAGAIDFPHWDEAHIDGHGFAVAELGRGPTGYFDSVVRVDPAHGVADRFRYDAGCLVEEHRFVPRPGGNGPRDGWLLGTVLDWQRGRSGLSLLDARDLAAGPIAQAWLPHTLPLGFHGWFAPA